MHQSAVVYEALLLLLLLLLLVVVGIRCHAAICIDAYTSYAVNADAPLPCLQFMLLIFISSVATVQLVNLSLQLAIKFGSEQPAETSPPKCMVLEKGFMASSGSRETHGMMQSRSAADLSSASQVGRLWTSLADYYIRRGLIEKARDVYEEGLTTVTTVRDFSLIFDTLTQVLCFSLYAHTITECNTHHTCQLLMS